MVLSISSCNELLQPSSLLVPSPPFPTSTQPSSIRESPRPQTSPNYLPPVSDPAPNFRLRRRLPFKISQSFYPPALSRIFGVFPSIYSILIKIEGGEELTPPSSHLLPSLFIHMTRGDNRQRAMYLLTHPLVFPPLWLLSDPSLDPPGFCFEDAPPHVRPPSIRQPDYSTIVPTTPPPPPPPPTPPPPPPTLSKPPLLFKRGPPEGDPFMQPPRYVLVSPSTPMTTIFKRFETSEFLRD